MKPAKFTVYMASILASNFMNRHDGFELLRDIANGDYTYEYHLRSHPVVNQISLTIVQCYNSLRVKSYSIALTQSQYADVVTMAKEAELRQAIVDYSRMKGTK